MSAPPGSPRAADPRARDAAATSERYALLALALAPPSAELERAVAQTAGPFALPRIDPGELLIEHTRLFVGPGRAPAPLYGSVYLDGGVLMGESTADVLRQYREAGFALAPDAGSLPDHATVELSFLSLLAEEAARAWESGDAPTARLWLGRRGAFLCDHLGAWATALSQRIISSTSEPFYRAVAVNLREVVAADLEALLVAVGEADHPASAPQG